MAQREVENPHISKTLEENLVSCLPPIPCVASVKFLVSEAPAPRDGKMDIKMTKVGRKGGYCLIILKNMSRLLGPNNLLLMLC